VTVVYNDDARLDLIEIGIYTVLEWGDEQWARYRALLEDACESIIPARIERAQPVPTHPGVLRWRSGRHVIYFQRTESGIEILRVLHERMLPERHF
jgi:toxin ParE1/3/4